LVEEKRIRSDEAGTITAKEKITTN
jgi:hypothetical protein